MVLVGPPKTGSTHVQSFLEANAAELRKHGWTWPNAADGGVAGAKSFANLVGALSNRSCSPTIWKAAPTLREAILGLCHGRPSEVSAFRRGPAAVRSIFRDEFRHVAQSGAPNLVFSAEDLAYYDGDDEDDVHARGALFELLRPFEERWVVIVHRQPRAAALQSVFTEELDWVKDGALAASDARAPLSHWLYSKLSDGQLLRQPPWSSSLNLGRLADAYNASGFRVIVVSMAGAQHDGVGLAESIVCEVLGTPCTCGRADWSRYKPARTYESPKFNGVAHSLRRLLPGIMRSAGCRGNVDTIDPSDTEVSRVLREGAVQRCSDLSALDEMLEGFDERFIHRYRESTLHWRPPRVRRLPYNTRRFCELDATREATLVAIRRVFGEGHGLECSASEVTSARLWTLETSNQPEQPPPQAEQPQQPPPPQTEQTQQHTQQQKQQHSPRAVAIDAAAVLFAQMLAKCATPNAVCSLDLQSTAAAARARTALSNTTGTSDECPLPPGAPSVSARVGYVLLTSPFARRSEGRGQGPVEESSVLRMHLRALVALPTTLITRLLVMLPSEPARTLVDGYLDIEPEAAQLPFPATLVRVPNNTLGSYGMYFEAYRRSDNAFEYLLFSEDDYIPVRAYFDAALVRMYRQAFEGTASAAAGGHGVLCGLLQGRPVEASSPYQLHAESSHIMSAATLSHIFSRTYGAPTHWHGDLISRSFHLLEQVEGVRVEAYYDRVQLGFGALMRDAGVPMRDWTSAYRSPYWNHEYIADWSGAAHDFRVPLERVLFAPIQWPFTERIRLCCSPADCIYLQGGTSCSLQRTPSRPRQRHHGCCPESGVSSALLSVRAAASVPSHAADVRDAWSEAVSGAREQKQRRRACMLDAVRLVDEGRNKRPERTVGEFLQMDGSAHAAYTARLRAAVAPPSFFDEPLGGVHEVTAAPPPPRKCCSQPGRPAISASADPAREWFGDLTCIECAACDEARSPAGAAGSSADSTARKLAVLMLGHRRRLIFETVMTNVLGASTRSGHSATVFMYLENGTMWTPYLNMGGDIHEHPLFRRLTDAQLRARLGALVRSVGGKVGAILIDRRVAASFPTSNASWSDWRLFRIYAPHALNSGLPLSPPLLPPRCARP